MTFDGSQIPQALRNLNQWLCWQKPTKIPIDPRTGRNTQAPPAAWSYEECITAAAEKGYGIGFSLKNGIFGVDLDHVLDETGQLKPEYAHLSEIVDKTGSYTEISPSGEGLHIFARCDDIPQECRAGPKREGNVEMYCEGRYFTVTGNAWEYPGVLRTLTGDEYREIHTLLFGGTTPAPDPTTPPTRTAPPEVDFSGLDIPGPNEEPKTPDHIIIRNLRKRSRHGRALWRGDTRGYPSPSEADAALMVMLADACDYNIYQMERLFLQSGLAKRDKAQNRPDYIRRTAIHAIEYVCRQNAALEIKRSHAPRWRRPHPNNFGEARIRVTQGGGETQMTPPDKDEQDITQLAGECGAVVEGLYRYCRRKSPMHQPEIALFTALTVIGIVCGRIWEADIVKYKSPRGEIKEIPPTTTTDYLLILAGTGTGKESVKSVIRDLLEAAKLDIPTPPLATGINAIHTAAQKNPRVTFITDEAGLNRQTTGTGKGDPNGKKTVETYQMDIYASRSTVTNPQLYATGKDNPNLKRIWRNALSVVLLSTQETFAQALGSDDAHSGYLSRYVILNATRGREPELGRTDITPAEEADADAETQKMIAPFLEWAQTHAGSPEYDTYAQLIPPSMAAAWRVLAGLGATPAETGELQAIDHATYVHYPPRPQKGEMPPCPQHIRAGPDPVRWEPAARSKLMRIYAENEAYCRDHPDAKDLLTRKLQHVMIYAMRIALACDVRHADRFSPFAVLLLKKAKDALDAANEEREAAQEALTTAQMKKKTPSKATRERLEKAIIAKEERRTKYLKAIVCVRDGIRMTYADHPTMITAEHVKTALKIIDFTLKSSLQHIADAIPPQTWIDAKDRVIQILRDQYKKNGEGIPKSRIERRLRTYHFGEKWQVLIDEMEYDDIIRYGEPAPNGGCMIYLTEYDPRS